MYEEDRETQAVLITTDEQLRDFCARAQGSEVLAIDTEFLREKTYRARLCLVQLGTDDEQVAVDPFCVQDVEPLVALFKDPAITKVLHACSQDMEVLQEWCGTLPSPIFDTQMAASFISDRYQIGYGALVEDFCHVHLPKAESLTDWSARPLDAKQIAYALDDVRYLPDIWRTMRARLEELGRTAWLEDDFAHACDPQSYRHDPREAYRKVKRVGSLSRRQMSVAREVAAWRENLAAKIDKPRRWVMGDELLAEIAKRMPNTDAALMRIRGGADLSAQDRAEVLAAVRAGVACPPELYPDTPHRSKPSLESECVCDLMYALTRMVADREHIASSILASRDELIDYFEHRASSPLSRGWRHELLGSHLDALLEGQIGLTVVDGKIELL